ncbi:MAG TPA: serine hydroxymethyltransferase [Chloroflexota bacterium]|nr:serine hydroxymethyltransferase [Chloroflexota bacterium]
MTRFQSLAAADPEAYDIVRAEERRQSEKIVLIASENHTSPAVLEATGSVLTDKYAEGYPGRRYYGGVECVDRAEELALDRVGRLFGAEHANVQPHAGAMANMAAYRAVLKPGDRVLAMNLSHGGHLTHGAQFNFSGKLYDFQWYGVDQETEQLDYDAIQRQAEEFRPQLLVAGASAYSRVIDFPRLRAIADGVNALLMVDMAHIAGLIAGGTHPSPVPHADLVTSTTHKTLRGPRGGLILCREQYAKKVDQAVFPYMQGGPFMHSILAKAVCFQEALQPGFGEYTRLVVENARALASGLQRRDIRIVSGGTDNHLMLVDLRCLPLNGLDAQLSLDEVQLSTNKNMLPFDPLPATQTSGIRLGTPAATTRGMGSAEMDRIADWIARRLAQPEDEGTAAGIRSEVAETTARFPVPGVQAAVPA